MPGKHWNRHEDKLLRLLWGHKDVARIASKLGRTVRAVEHRSRVLCLQSTRDLISLPAFMRQTGYDRRQIERACKALGITLPYMPRVSVHRLSKRYRARAISDTLGERVIAWIKERTRTTWRLYGDGRKTVAVAWGVGWKPKRCRKCRSSRKPHRARGYCSACYNQVRRAERAQER